MTEEEFLKRIRAAKVFLRQLETPDLLCKESDFWTGYIRGVNRLYHGSSYGTEEEHKRWMRLIWSEDESQRMRGEGYQSGFKGMDIKAAIAAKEREI